MAFKYGLLLLVLIFLLRSQSGTPFFDSYMDACGELYMKSDTAKVVGFGRIIKALRSATTSSDYEIMTSVLENHLTENVDPCCDKILFFIDRQKRFTIYGQDNATVTLFVPRDEAVRFEPWMCLHCQIVLTKIDKKAFETASLVKGSRLPACGYYGMGTLVVNEASVNGSVVISGAKITDWDLYNDGHVIVHGTDDFFQHHKIGIYEHRRPPRMKTDMFEVV